MNDQNLKPVRTTEEARERGAKGGASPKRKKTLEAKRIMSRLLMSRPMIGDATKEHLRRIGVDPDDEELTSNAAVLSAAIMQKAFAGDPEFIRMAFEIAGQPTTIRDAVALEDLKLRQQEQADRRKAARDDADAPDETGDSFLAALAAACAPAWDIQDVPANINDSDDPQESTEPQPPTASPNSPKFPPTIPDKGKQKKSTTSKKPLNIKTFNPQ